MEYLIEIEKRARVLVSSIYIYIKGELRFHLDNRRVKVPLVVDPFT